MDFAETEDVGETVADEVDKGDDISSFIDCECFLFENIFSV